MNQRIVKFADDDSAEIERKAREKIIISIRNLHVYGSYRRQEWSLPDSIIFYITKNPSSVKCYHKMIQSCKCFFIKNPIFVTNLYSNGKNGWNVSSAKVSTDLSDIKCRVWIDGGIHAKVFDMPNLISSIIPKIFRCDAKRLTFYNQSILFKELSVLTSVAEEIEFFNVSIKNKDATEVAFESIVSLCQNLKMIRFQSQTSLSNISSQTMKELLKIPHFTKIKILSLSQIPGSFDIEAFYDYMKKNKYTRFEFQFAASISEAYEKRLESIIDEILKTKEFYYKPPLLDFPELDHEKYFKLLNLCYWI